MGKKGGGGNLKGKKKRELLFQECSKESQDVNVVRGMGGKKEYRWNAYEEEREGGDPGRGELLQHNNISDNKY